MNLKHCYKLLKQMEETVLQVFKRGKIVAVMGMNTMPNFKFMQKVHLENFRWEDDRITNSDELFGRVWKVKHILITDTIYKNNEWHLPVFKAIVQLYLF